MLFRDEYFVSTVSKEKRWLDQQNGDYSFDRVVAFSQEIASYGMKGMTSTIDRCKVLITCMGNVLGLIRLLRTGQMYAHNQTIQYKASIPSAFGVVAEEGLSQPKNYGSNDYIVKSQISDLEGFDKICHCPDFLQSSVDALAELFVSKLEHSHLDSFYVIVPALSLSWLDNSLRAKEMLVKKFKTFDSYYTDDGFAVGSAFLLTILRQNEKLDGLNWFDSFRIKFAMERKSLLDRVNEVSSFDSASSKKSIFTFGSGKGVREKADNIASTHDDSLTRLKVTAQRLEMRKREMEMLHDSLHSARLFFKDE